MKATSMTNSPLKPLLLELIHNPAGTAASLDDAKAKPGTVAEVDEATYFYYLEALPPQFMSGGAFGFAEGAEPYLLFWCLAARYFVRQLTWDETVLLARSLRIPTPGNW